MAQINLLKHNQTPGQTLGTVTSWGVKILIVAILVMIGYYGYVWYQVRQQDAEVLRLQEEVQQEKAKANAIKELGELNLRLKQLSEYENLLSKHVYWSSFLPKLAGYTYNGGLQYTGIKMTNDNSVVVDFIVPDLAGLDKFLQVFNVPSVNEQFRNVRISSYEKEVTDTTSRVRGSLKFDYNPKLLEYQKQYDKK